MQEQQSLGEKLRWPFSLMASPLGSILRGVGMGRQYQALGDSHHALWRGPAHSAIHPDGTQPLPAAAAGAQLPASPFDCEKGKAQRRQVTLLARMSGLISTQERLLMPASAFVNVSSLTRERLV